MPRSPKSKKTNGKDEKKRKLSPLEEAGLPTGRYQGGFRVVAQIPGVSRGHLGRRRILGHQQVNCYHVMSRTTGGEVVLGNDLPDILYCWA